MRWQGGVEGRGCDGAALQASGREAQGFGHAARAPAHERMPELEAGARARHMRAVSAGHSLAGSNMSGKGALMPGRVRASGGRGGGRRAGATSVSRAAEGLGYTCVLGADWATVGQPRLEGAPADAGGLRVREGSRAGRRATEPPGLPGALRSRPRLCCAILRPMCAAAARPGPRRRRG